MEFAPLPVPATDDALREILSEFFEPINVSSGTGFLMRDLSADEARELDRRISAAVETFVQSAANDADTNSPSAPEPLNDQLQSLAAMRGAWVTLDLADGSRLTVRFVRPRHNRWEFDHGAYGAHRADCWILANAITKVSPAQRPARVLSFVDPFGKRQRVGRFATQQEADKEIEPLRRLVTDVRFE